MNNKLLCFEYVLTQLISWYKELSPDDAELVSFTRLKVLKLLFFVATIRLNDTAPINEDNDLLNIFDNFYAMQHGPVESDVYNAMVSSNLEHYDFKSLTINIGTIDNNSFNTINRETRDRIDVSIQLLRNNNENIVLYTAAQLVELSHKWDCWKMVMHMAELFSKGSMLMRVEIIRNSRKYFAL